MQGSISYFIRSKKLAYRYDGIKIVKGRQSHNPLNRLQIAYSEGDTQQNIRLSVRYTPKNPVLTEQLIEPVKLMKLLNWSTE